MNAKTLSFKYLTATSLSKQHQQPHSKLFDDIYFNTADGLAEANYVFIQGNDLNHRWVNAKNQAYFVVAETGFGTGLNLLALLHQWHTSKDKPKHLNYISVEKFPLKLEDLKTAHAAFPKLKEYSEQLLKVWQSFSEKFRCGWHRFELSPDVSLTLGFGDATEQLKQLKATVHAWFLDGFTPKKNPDMWQDDLFFQVNRLSQAGSTIATFTAASKISKSLSEHGFTVTKKPGYGRKREMITAVYKQGCQQAKIKQPWAPLPTQKSNNQKVTILGAGIAGLSLAYQFKRAGYHTTVIEQNTQAMQNASGNALAMVMPLITADHSPESLLYSRAFDYAQNFYEADEYFSIGVEQLIGNNKEKHWVTAIKNAKLPPSLVQVNQQQNTVFYSQAGYVDTQQVAKRLSQSVDQWLNFQISEISQSGHHWQLHTSNETQPVTAELLIIANGIQAQKSGNSFGVDFGLTARHGMTSVIKAPHPNLNHIQLGDGYVIPDQSHQRWICGATFDHLPEPQWYKSTELTPEHWSRNCDLWLQYDLFNTLKAAKVIGGHAAIRATTADHLPICGPCIDQSKFRTDYADLHHGRHWQNYPQAVILDNLYVLNGLGSRGFTSAPLLAQLLCAMVSGEPLPLEADLCQIIHPNRFLYRSLKKPPKHKKTSLNS